jgi:hypothetical protein
LYTSLHNLKERRSPRSAVKISRWNNCNEEHRRYALPVADDTE